MSNQKRWNYFIKTAIILAFAWFLIQRFQAEQDISSLWKSFLSRWQSGDTWIFLLVVLLMPLNWFLEVMKWRRLMKPAISLSWRRATAAVLSGITFSLFTPNRIGEYGGRLLHINRKYAWQAVIASLTGSFAQNLIHISFGIVAVMLMFHASLRLPEVTSDGLGLLTAIVLLAIWCIYWFLPQMAGHLSKQQPPRLLKKPWKALQHLSVITRAQLGFTVLCALSRYLIFSLQYVLLLMYFGADIPWYWLAGGVAVIYLMHTSIPLPPVVDLIARNELGILLWTGLGVNELSIVAAGLAIWVLNLALPALFGLLAIASTNVLRTVSDANDTEISDPVQYPGRVWDSTSR